MIIVIVLFSPVSFICLILLALSRGINFLRRPTNTLECMNVILLHSNHRHVSAARRAIFKVVRTIMQLQLMCRNQSTAKKNRTFFKIQG